jgi:sigma-E factor negative regulatory protein RseC
MLEQQATVVNIDANNDVWVLAARQSACGSCQQSEQCHPSSVLTAPSLAIQVKKNQHDLKIGDEVVIEIAEKTLWHGLFYLYVYPLGALVVGAMLGQFLEARNGVQS